MKKLILLLLITGIGFTAELPTVTYEFVNKQIISASKINTNFNDGNNSDVDGTKRHNIGDLAINGTVRIDGNGSVIGVDGTFSDDVVIVDDTKIGGDLAVTGNTSLVGTLTVTGDVTFSGQDKVLLTKSSDQAISSGGGNTDVIWETETYDTGGLHAASSANVVIVNSGVYLLEANIRWDSNITGNRTTLILADGVGVAGSVGAPDSTGSATIQATSAVGSFTAGDIIKVQVNQSSGGSLNVDSTGVLTHLSVTRLY